MVKVFDIMHNLSLIIYFISMCWSTKYARLSFTLKCYIPSEMSLF